jgi:hypothetical protein
MYALKETITFVVLYCVYAGYVRSSSKSQLFWDLLFGCRDLSLQEWNFGVIIKNKLLVLLEQQKIYWRQRGAIKWVSLGDATTKFFHANATIRMRGNLIK